jgi:putative endonuclease
MPYVVYVLYSEKDRNLYVGCTSDIESRIHKHNHGEVPATKHRLPLVSIHQEVFSEKRDAFNRERFLKSLWGAREKMRIKKDFLKQHKAS